MQKHSLSGSWANTTSLFLKGSISRQTLYTASKPGYHQQLMHSLGVVKNELRNKAQCGFLLKEKPSLTRAASLLALALAVVLALGLALLGGAFRRAFLGLALLIVALFAFLRLALLALSFRRICRFSRTLPLSFARRRIGRFSRTLPLA